MDLTLTRWGMGGGGRRDSSSLRRSKAIWELREEQELPWGKGREKHSRQEAQNVQIWPGGKECGEDLKNKARWEGGCDTNLANSDSLGKLGPCTPLHAQCFIDHGKKFLSPNSIQ